MKPAATAPEHPAYTTMCSEAKKCEWPKVYFRDLEVHDREFLAKRERQECFGWILWEYGTHLVSVTPISKDALPAGEYLLMAAKAFASNAQRYFWWDGRSLTEVPTVDQLARMAESEEQRLKRAQSPGGSYVGQFQAGR